jgi:flagellin
MTRINTNVPSLVAQQRLGRNNTDLQTALARLSTGLRINSAKDDPAGLIASENLRRDITVVNKAITNSERASQLIATTEGALGQVSNLLNDIRGLVTEAANSGALSASQIAANQLQIDSSLEAIDRISQVTTFQGSRLLDGSLGFLTTGGAGFSTITDFNIDQANLGTTGNIAVSVDITAAATQASIVESGTATAKAVASLTFSAGDQTTALTNATIFSIESDTLGFAAGADVVLVDDVGGAGNETADYNAGTNVLSVHYDGTASTAQHIIDAINSITVGVGSQFTAAISTGAGGDLIVAGDAGSFGTLNYDQINITAAAAGALYNNVSIVVQGGAADAANYNSTSKILTVTIDNDGASTIAEVRTKIDNLAEFSALVAGSPTGDLIVGGTGDIDLTATANTNTTGGAVLDDSVTFRVSGESGSEVFTFASGATYSDISAAINLVSDATGVSTTVASGNLTFTSTGYGSDAVVDIEVIAEGTSGNFATNLNALRTTGTDIAATINGVSATGKANTLSLNTTALDLSFSVALGSSTDIAFTITGGGAIFQLGGQVVSNQQARLGIASIATARLGGATGRLFELGSGNARDLLTDVAGAAAIVDEVIDKISSLRGRLGAFERTTLNTNIRSLQDTVANLVKAESSIRDADFAAESAALTRAQILVQSGTSVLAIANQNPQNVLALLG